MRCMPVIWNMYAQVISISHQSSHILFDVFTQMGGSELQDKVVESLFKAYFVDNKSLGEASVLEDCATQAGMTDMSDFLSDLQQPGEAEVREEMQQYGRSFQCTGVPMFIIDGRAVLNGAQESDAFLKTFARL